MLAGIPIAIFGLAAWIAALVLTIWNSELARTLTAALAVVVLAFAAYLVILQLFVIDAVCVWCMANDVFLTPLFVVLALARMWTAPRRLRRRDGQSYSLASSPLHDPRKPRTA